jgi:hypothetical protein
MKKDHRKVVFNNKILGIDFFHSYLFNKKKKNEEKRERKKIRIRRSGKENIKDAA